MDARETVKEIMKTQNVSNAELARKLNITQATLWERLNNRKMRKDIPLSSLVEMLESLNYSVYLVPNTSPIPNGGYEVTRSEKTEPISSNKAKEKATALLDSLPDPKPVQNPIDTTSGKVKIKLT